jgi:hypothetical protein
LATSTAPVLGFAVGGQRGQSFNDAWDNVEVYRVRILDDEVRRQARQFNSLCVRAVMMPHDGETDEQARARALSAAQQMSAAMHSLNERIGEQLRELL